MNNSETFKAAHKMAKLVIKSGDNYSVTFSECLRLLKSKLSYDKYFGVKGLEGQPELISFSYVAEKYGDYLIVETESFKNGRYFDLFIEMLQSGQIV